MKNGADRIVVLNSVAQSVVESQRGLHPEFVFAYSQIRKQGKTPVYRPTETMNKHVVPESAETRRTAASASSSSEAYVRTAAAGGWGFLRGPAGLAWAQVRTDDDALFGG